MKILYFYEEVMGYTLATIQALSELGAEVHVVHWDHKKITTFELPKVKGVTFYPRSQMLFADILNLAFNLSPSLIVVSGWNDKDYLSASKILRKKNFKTVLALDGQWKRSPKQYVARLLGKISWFKNYYSHAWVAGTYQHEYASMLGFDRQDIVVDLYSSDLALFHKAYIENYKSKITNYPHRFLFVGRFESVKGLDILLKAWNIIGESRRDWELHLVGNGSLKNKMQPTVGVVVKNFMQPGRLMEEAAYSGCFVLPSRSEPWGVVVHEFAAAGMPLIVSDVVGAASAFLISGLNGFSFKVDDAQALANRMQKIINSSDQQLIAMAEASHNLSHRITPLTSAANLLSIIVREKE
jgi:glycosyltransferase involved in cell wall biosynthesis